MNAARRTPVELEHDVRNADAFCQYDVPRTTPNELLHRWFVAMTHLMGAAMLAVGRVCIRWLPYLLAALIVLMFTACGELQDAEQTELRLQDLDREHAALQAQVRIPSPRKP